MAKGRTKGKHHPRTIDKLKLIIRLELGSPNLSIGQICQIVGISQVRLATLRKLPIYTILHNQYMTGVITRLDKRVEDNYDLTSQTMKFSVPIAMQNLVQQAMNAKDERIKNKACNDILDRDGRFAKVTRTNLIVENDPNKVADKDNDEANTLIKALQTAKTNQSAQKLNSDSNEIETIN